MFINTANYPNYVLTVKYVLVVRFNLSSYKNGRKQFGSGSELNETSYIRIKRDNFRDKGFYSNLKSKRVIKRLKRCHVTTLLLTTNNNKTHCICFSY